MNLQRRQSVVVNCLNTIIVLSLTFEVTHAVTVSYETDVLPILRAKCYRCHSGRRQEGSLQLDLRNAVLRGGDSGPGLVPGDKEKSLIWQRIVTKEVAERMPLDAARLNEAEIDVISKWIDAGVPGLKDASEQAHWAFQTLPRQIELPRVKDVTWVRNSIDRFVLAEIEKHDLSVAPPAEPARLVRRLHFDLVGLPPAPNVVSTFCSHPSDSAYLRMVDRLLSAPQFGERWGRHWLDLARYADSGGYEADLPRTIWPYRDWVINAFNSDKPIDTFVIEQLGGDLLKNATDQTRIATGFHANAMLDNGVRHEAVFDRVNTTGAVFLGLTLECAQCHDHKTDPISQKEYYQLYAFFNSSFARPVELETRGALTKNTSLTLVHEDQQTHIFLRGDHNKPGEVVESQVPAFLRGIGAETQPGRPWNRADLGRWLVHPDHPLYARVTANRIWMRLLGGAIVDSENDFGMQTPRPRHLALLDYLALELQSRNSFKDLIRLVVTSATYRQSSDFVYRKGKPTRFFVGQRRLRLEAELLRDNALSVSGLLVNRIGGPSVFPAQPEGILQFRATPATWTESTGDDRYRRGMYTHHWRLTQHPLFTLFDGPDVTTACTRRTRSNVAVQSLALLNDPSFLEPAQALAGKLVRERHRTDERIDELFLRCLGRRPSEKEEHLVSELLVTQKAIFARHPQSAAITVGPYKVDECSETIQAAWVGVCRSIMNLDEFITRE